MDKYAYLDGYMYKEAGEPSYKQKIKDSPAWKAYLADTQSFLPGAPMRKYLNRYLDVSSTQSPQMNRWARTSKGGALTQSDIEDMRWALPNVGVHPFFNIRAKERSTRLRPYGMYHPALKTLLTPRLGRRAGKELGIHEFAHAVDEKMSGKADGWLTLKQVSLPITNVNAFREIFAESELKATLAGNAYAGKIDLPGSLQSIGGRSGSVAEKALDKYGPQYKRGDTYSKQLAKTREFIQAMNKVPNTKMGEDSYDYSPVRKDPAKTAENVGLGFEYFKERVLPARPK